MISGEERTEERIMEDRILIVDDEELIKWYEKAKVYVQVSAHEGFGMSLAEAMLHQCVPVVTNRGALPEVVGDTGFYVPFNDKEATAEGIKKALKSDKGILARKRIEDRFSLTKRDAAISEVVELLHH